MPCASFSFPFTSGKLCNSPSYSLREPHISQSPMSYFPVLTKTSFAFYSHSPKGSLHSREIYVPHIPAPMCQSSLLYSSYHHPVVIPILVFPQYQPVGVPRELVPFRSLFHTLLHSKRPLHTPFLPLQPLSCTFFSVLVP